MIMVAVLLCATAAFLFAQGIKREKGESKLDFQARVARTEAKQKEEASIKAFKEKHDEAYSLAWSAINDANKGNYDKAVADANRAFAIELEIYQKLGPGPSRINPNVNQEDFLGRAFFLLGDVYYAVKDYKQAIADYTSAKLNTRLHNNEFVNLGLAYFYEGQYTEAINTLRNLDTNTINKEGIKVYSALILSYARLGGVNNLNKAEEYIEEYNIQASRSGQNNADLEANLYYELGESYYRASIMEYGKEETRWRGERFGSRAENYLKLALNKNPNHQKAKDSLAKATDLNKANALGMIDITPLMDMFLEKAFEGKTTRYNIKKAVKATSEVDARQQVESMIRSEYPTANNINITRIHR